MIKPRKLKNLKRGEYFTLRPVAEPKESQVYIKGEYDRYEKKYECIKFSDMCNPRLFKGDKEVYTDFILFSDETPGRQLPPWFHSLPLSQSLAKCTEPPHTKKGDLYDYRGITRYSR